MVFKNTKPGLVGWFSKTKPVLVGWFSKTNLGLVGWSKTKPWWSGSFQKLNRDWSGSFQRLGRIRNVRELTFWHMCTAETNQPACLRSLISVFVVGMKKVYILAYSKCAQWRFWSDCANAHADLNLRWAHMSEGPFSNVRAQMVILFLFSHCVHCTKSVIVFMFHRKLVYKKKKKKKKNQMRLNTVWTAIGMCKHFSG